MAILCASLNSLAGVASYQTRNDAIKAAYNKCGSAWTNIGTEQWFKTDEYAKHGLVSMFVCSTGNNTNEFFMFGSTTCLDADGAGRCQPRPDEDDDNCRSPSGGSPKAGNPVLILSGKKVQRETDYQDSQTPSLSLTRLYSSTLGRWIFSFEKHLIYTPALGTVDVYRPDGRVLEYHRSNRTWVDDQPYFKTSNVVENLLPTHLSDGQIGWKLITSDNIQELYNKSGDLVEERNLVTGETTTFTRNAEEVVVTDSKSRSVRYKVDDDRRITEFTSANNLQYKYTYDSNGNLKTVTNPENATVTYHYEDSRFVSALTGITDEKGLRYATWRYDEKGRAISSEHHNEADKVSIDFAHTDDAADPRVTYKNSLGKETTYHFQWVNGSRKVKQVEGHASENCVASNNAYTYDNKGFVDTVTDWEGNITDYDHNERGLEVKRIEAKGTPEERVILTEWHPTLRLPIKITEPDRITEFTYDDDGKLKSKSIQPVAAN
ncbi:DUF6531 domain-containing protein [Hahella sp. KA22]|uniref:DUF6531 domain-containing protein n=1 Tax=Hahella sp. KA22 TaxID=1628392 RepID=UPI0013E34F7A|nr:DUF6531 domain-containing protein [Hahella sp. KA22]